ncbi:hypothetical protein MQX03_11140 [Chryseobacterium aahli]|uniref:hypothetical protein n=1 Tax=Chryseobacterium aahli TaxID=1278643 RepID=UPI001F60EE27|nr:hypothetical protein [Chryseobacterium aahli]MCI3937759.1 hypothetical protein [Chryseobacterium aahli]
MKKIFLLSAITMFAFGFSQQNVSITNLQPKTDISVFPLVSITNNKKAEEKINTFLQVSHLENIPNSKKNPFVYTESEKLIYGEPMHFYEWKKLNTPKNILSLSILGESIDGTPIKFNLYKNFDARTGNLISNTDLFQENSVSTVEKLIESKIKKKIDDFLKEITAKKNPDKNTKLQIEIYETCITDNILMYLDYYFENQSITFMAPRCANNLPNLDILGTFYISFSNKELESYFSEYAKNLLSNNENAIPTKNLNYKLYKGKIEGKNPITFLFSTINEDGSFSAIYWTDDEKKLNTWDGNFTGNHISIIEKDSFDDKTRKWITKSTIEMDLTQNKMSGTWQDFKTKKYLKIELEEL